jgi:hypothetical protein
MGRPKLDNLLFVTFVASLISFVMPWMAGSVGRIRIGISIATLIVAFCTAVLAIVVHRKRGLWVILAAVPALFWPAVVISFVARARSMVIVTDLSRSRRHLQRSLISGGAFHGPPHVKNIFG